MLEYIPEVLVHAFAPCLDYIPPVICYQKDITAIVRAQPVLEGTAWTLSLCAGHQNPSVTALSSLC